MMRHAAADACRKSRRREQAAVALPAAPRPRARRGHGAAQRARAATRRRQRRRGSTRRGDVEQRTRPVGAQLGGSPPGSVRRSYRWRSQLARFLLCVFDSRAGLVVPASSARACGVLVGRERVAHGRQAPRRRRCDKPLLRAAPRASTSLGVEDAATPWKRRSQTTAAPTSQTRAAAAAARARSRRLRRASAAPSTSAPPPSSPTPCSVLGKKRRLQARLRRAAAGRRKLRRTLGERASARHKFAPVPAPRRHVVEAMLRHQRRQPRAAHPAALGRAIMRGSANHLAVGGGADLRLQEHHWSVPVSSGRPRPTALEEVRQLPQQRRHARGS